MHILLVIVVVIIVFLIGTKVIFLFRPGLALKSILLVVLSMGCVFLMLRLLPDFSFFGRGKEVEADIGENYDQNAISWTTVNSIDQLSGYWHGTNRIIFPENTETRSPEFFVLFAMTLRRNEDAFDISMRVDMENYFEELVKMYPTMGFTKESLWAYFINDDQQSDGFIYENYCLELEEFSVPLESLLNETSLQIDNSGTYLKYIIPKRVISIGTIDSMECILAKDK